MSLEETEVKVGDVKLKGIWIAVALSVLTTCAGAVWGAAEFYGRITELEEVIETFDQEELNTKLVSLGTNLERIMESQEVLLDLRDRVAEAEKQVQEGILRVNQMNEKVGDIDNKFKKINREIDDIWKGLDAAANPLR